MRFGKRFSRISEPHSLCFYIKCEFTTVTVDSYKVARDITNFLIGDGHKRIAYVGGSKEDYTNGRLRLKGYQNAMKAAGLEIPDSYITREASVRRAVYRECARSMKTAGICRRL